MRRAKLARRWSIVAGAWLAFVATDALARKTNQAFYEDPFDQAAGGASLTRATREAVMLANPALMPYGGVFHRWVGMQYSLLASRESLSFAKTIATGNGNSSTSDGQTEKILDQAFKSPIHLGQTFALSYLTNNFGVGVFERFEPDVEAKRRGSTGVPSLTISAEAYAGAVTSMAFQTARWLSFGVTAKYLFAAEPEREFELTDVLDQSKTKDDVAYFQDLGKSAPHQHAVGVDFGALLFFQGPTVDYRLALKVDDVGDTKFLSTVADETPRESFKQTIHAGLGLTLHGDTQALHLAADYRDLTGAYEERTFKRIYLGAKLLLAQHFGLAAGLYQGIPSVGVRLDLIVFKLGFTAYGREMGDYIGEKQRNLYVAYFSFGI